MENANNGCKMPGIIVPKPVSSVEFHRKIMSAAMNAYTDQATDPDHQVRSETGMSSFFEILGMLDNLSSDVVERAWERVYETIYSRNDPRQELEFVFVRDPHREPTAHFGHSIPSIYEKCLLKITTIGGRDGQIAEPHDTLVERVLHGFRYLLVRKSTQAVYALEMERPTQKIDLDSRLSLDGVEFQKCMAVLGYDIPWRMTLTVDAGWRRAYSALDRETRLTRFIGLFLREPRLTERQRELFRLRDTNGQLSMASIQFDVWGRDPVEEAHFVNMAGCIVNGLGLPCSGVATVIPTADAIQLMPITRPAAPWGSGGMLYRTTDGKLFPYSMSSREFSGGGGGDLVSYQDEGDLRVYQDESSKALVREYGEKLEISRIRIGSERDFVEDQSSDVSGLFTHILMKPSPEYAVNMLDTPLGVSVPVHFENEIRFLSLLCDQVTEGFDRPFVSHFLNEVLKATFNHFDAGSPENGNFPKIYQAGFCKDVDQALLELSQGAPYTWWEAVDALHEAGNSHAAVLAQRYAIPNLTDLCYVLKTNDLLEYRYGRMTCDCPGVSIRSVIADEIQRLINLWPSLSGPTSIDFGEANLKSVWIDAAGRRADEIGAEKVGAIMFLQARKMLCDRYYSSPYVSGGYHPPSRFQEYHREQWMRGIANVRQVSFGECRAIHRNKWVAEQVIYDARYSNKCAVLMSVSTREYSPSDDFFRALSSLVVLSPHQANEDMLRRFDSYCERPQEVGGGLNVLMVKRGWEGGVIRQHLVLPSSPHIKS